MRDSWIPFATLSAVLVCLSACGSVDSSPLSPQDALESFRIAEGFRLELYASEPHVVDPVEMVFDENGGVYVAELLDNPDDPPEGEDPLSRIKYLEDTDGDGTVDRHTVFADRLLAVEGITPWKGGLIATAAPDILYLKDTDGDHRADVRETLYTGFALAHVEGRLSNPRLGIDNWFYVVNHGHPGEVTSPSRPDARPVNVRNSEFRFHPLRKLAEASTGDAQFGQDYNEWGHWFIAHNTVHLRHTVVPPGYLRRNPYFSVEAAEQDISDHGRPAANVFPISQPQRWRIERTEVRQRRYAETRPGREEQLAGYFTAASGSTVYLGDAFPPELGGSVFIGEGNGNLVHCDLLSPDGPTYTASRWPEDTDFLASADNWFRPVNFSNAPDGNLYLIDYYRQYLEHPMFIPDAVKKRLKMDFRAGDTLGRIYRIVPDSSRTERRQARLGSNSTEELVRLLGHPNGWHRRTAHRLLVERQDRTAVKHLRDVARTHDQPGVRLRALWVLEGLDSLGADSVEPALRDAHPAVRENALRLAEGFGTRFSDEMLAAHRDSDARVAFQATLSIGNLPVGPNSVDAMARVLTRYPDDKWFRTAVLSAQPSVAVSVFSAVVQLHAGFFSTPAAERKKYVRSVARIAGATRVPSEIGRFLGLVADSRPLSPAFWRTAALEGLSDGLALREGYRAQAAKVSSDALSELLNDPSIDVQVAAAGVARHFDLSIHVQKAKAVALDRSSSPEQRLVASRILQGGDYGDVAEALAALLSGPPDAELQLAAARSLASFGDSGAAETLLKAWRDSSKTLKDGIVETLIRRRGHAAALLRAVAEGRVKPEEIPAVTRIRLSQHPDDRVRRAAEASLALGVRARDEVIEENLPALQMEGHAGRGRDVFDRECANCHLAKASRGRIGPDLSGVNNRSKEDLLTSILDPSYAIDDRWRNHLVFTTDGRYYDGILVAETSATVTLRGEASDISVLKEDIADLRPSDVSLMPEGLEDAVTRQELADLIAFLRAGM